MTNQRNIAILLATYNSERFLREQIESIVNQSYTDWTLYIRDDSSTDSTPEIIDEYESKYDNIIVIRDSLGNLGCRDNFFRLLETVDSRYYMFSDADDVWLPDKIETSINKIQDIESSAPGKPILVHTDLTMVDENLNELHHSLWAISLLNPDKIKTYEYLAIHGYIHGCTTIFNQAAKQVSIPFSHDVYMHDQWLGLCTLKHGGIIESLHTPTILYRQHSNNVVGGTSEKKLRLGHKLTHLRSVWRENATIYKTLHKIDTRWSLHKYLYYKAKLVLMMRSGKMFD